MNELIPYLMQRLQQQGSTALANPGTALERLILNGEVQPPPRETNGKPATRMGPLIEGEAIRSIPGGGGGGALARAGGSLGGLMNHPLLAAIMGSIQGDVLNKHQPRMYGPQGPASPMGQVDSAPLPPVPEGPSPNDQVAARFGGMADPSAMTPNQYVRDNGMTPNDQVAARFGGMQPPAPQMTPNQYVAQNFPPQMAAGVPTPQPRPQMAQAPTPMPQPRPAQAPQEMGFFRRNAAMMQDPVTGMFIDPGAAAQAQASSPANINQMLGMLFNKANR